MPFIPSDSDLNKISKRRTRRGKPVKSNRVQEARLRRAMTDLWRDVLLPATERIKQLIRQSASTTAIANEIEQALMTANVYYSRVAPGIIDKWILGVDREVQNAIHRTMYDALGVDLSMLLGRPDVSDAMSLAGMQAASLIRTIPAQYLGDVARAVADNFSGAPLPEGRSLLQQIQHISSGSYKHSKLIARDQTSKLTAALNAHRQQAAGVTMYIWHNVGDRRVVGDPSGVSPVGSSAHGDHFHLEGKLCRWDDSTVYSENGGQTWVKRPAGWTKKHPGEDIQCRCWAEPIVEPIEVIKQIRSNQ